jgi:hypothetical protein
MTGSASQATGDLPVSGPPVTPVLTAPPPYEAVPSTLPSTSGSINDGEPSIINNSSTESSGPSGQDIEMREQ